MVNAKSSPENEPPVLSGLQQIEDNAIEHQLYKLVDLHGQGELLSLMKIAGQTGDHRCLDRILNTKVNW